MTQSDAVKLAINIARILLDGSCRVGQRAVGNQTLMGMLSVNLAAQRNDAAALNPHFHEIILFGSAADESSEPNDVDMMVFDSGFYSNVILSPSNPMGSSMYGYLEGNLPRLMTGWFGYGEGDIEVQAIRTGPSVDLLVLPVSIFTDVTTKTKIAALQDDPHFFENAFSCMRRFDPSSGGFEKTTLAFLEKKYRAAVDVEELLQIPGCNI